MVGKLLLLGLLTITCINLGAAQSRHALVVGNDSYPGNALANARNDASSVYKALKASGYDASLVLDANRGTLSDKVDKFLDGLHPGDTAMLYYAGHGMQVHGENYLIPTDFHLTSEASATEEGYSLSSLLERFTSHGATTQIVILDACRDNPFLGVRSEKGGWAGLGTSAGSFIAFGTSPGSTASDAPGEGHGLFTKSLLRYLTSSDLDIEEMLRKVREDVIRDSQGKQVPWVSSSLIGTYHVRPDLDLVATMVPIAGVAPPESSSPNKNARSIHDELLADDGRTALVATVARSPSSVPASSRVLTVDTTALTQVAVLLQQQQFAEAILKLNALLVSTPDNSIALRLLGLAFHAAGRDGDAVIALERAVSADSNDARGASYKCALEGLINSDTALSDCSRLVRLQPSSDSFFALAAVQELRNDGDRAFANVSQAIALGGSDLSYALRGAMSVQLGQKGAATRDFSRATELATPTPSK